MKKNLQKMLCLSLSAMLVMGSVPSTVWADEEIPEPVAEEVVAQTEEDAEPVEDEIPAQEVEEEAHFQEEERTAEEMDLLTEGSVENTAIMPAKDSNESVAEVNEPEAEEDSDGLVISKSIFPDQEFYLYVSEYLDPDRDGVLSDAELASIEEIDIVNTGVNSLQGIEYFPNLKTLDCSARGMSSLDVSKNTALETLYCYENSLTVLDVSKNTALKVLNCSFNQLSELNLGSNSALEELYCDNNQLTRLDVSAKPALRYLDCVGNQLTDLNVNGSAALKVLICYNNKLTKLDVSSNTALEYLDCGTNRLAVLDVSGNPVLETLFCYGNGLTKLNVSANPALKELGCDSNSLKELNVSSCTALETLYCGCNELTKLDISNNEQLVDLDCSANQISVLNTGNNSELKSLICAENDIVNLDLSKSPKLSFLNCIYNHLMRLNISSEARLSALYCSDNHLTSLDVEFDPSAEEEASNEVFDGDGQTYSLPVTAGETYDLSRLPAGFEISRASGWTGGTVNGTKLKANLYIDKVTYGYQVDEEGKYRLSVALELSDSPLTKLPAPVLTGVANDTAGVTVKWNPVNGAARYRVYYKTNGGSWTRAGETTESSFTVTGLTSGNTYTFTVRCLNEAGEFSSYFDTKGKTITYVAMPVISSVANAAAGVTVKWGAVKGAAKYRVYYKTNGGSWTRAGDTKSTSYTVTGLKSGTEYTFTVRCLNSAGAFCSTFDRTGKSITYVAAPVLSSVANAPTGVTVKWAAVEGAAEYRVFYKTSGGSWTRGGDTTSTSYTVTGLKSGTGYTFTVRCLNESGSYISAFDSKGKTIRYLATPAVTAAKAAKGVSVRWSKVTGATGYYVYRKTAGGSWTRIKQIKSGSTVTYTDTTAKKGTTYIYTVRAYYGSTLGSFKVAGASATAG